MAFIYAIIEYKVVVGSDDSWHIIDEEELVSYRKFIKLLKEMIEKKVVFLIRFGDKRHNVLYTCDRDLFYLDRDLKRYFKSELSHVEKKINIFRKRFRHLSVCQQAACFRLFYNILDSIEFRGSLIALIIEPKINGLAKDRYLNYTKSTMILKTKLAEISIGQLNPDDRLEFHNEVDTIFHNETALSWTALDKILA